MKRILFYLVLCLWLPQLHGAVGTKISSLPQIATPSTNSYFELSDMSATPKSRKLWLLDLRRYFLNATANTLTKWTGTNTVGSLANGEGLLANDGAGGFVWTTNVGAISETIIYDTTITTNQFFLSGKGNTLIVTQVVQFAWSALTMSGSNVSAINLTNSSLFKLRLTNDAFLVAPINFPGTNFGGHFQVHIEQDGTGGRSLMATNSSWVISGSGTSTNAVLDINTNANAVSVLTFSTSPFTSSKVYGVLTPF